MGNFADSTDANGKSTHYDYYQAGPQTGYLQDVIQNASQEKTSYTYDAMGKVLTTTDACGNGSCPDMTVGTTHTTTYTYDQLERVSTITDASGVTKKFLYDNNSNKTDEIEAFGTSLQRTTHYDYDKPEPGNEDHLSRRNHEAVLLRFPGQHRNRQSPAHKPPRG